jgi:flavodoxin
MSKSYKLKLFVPGLIIIIILGWILFYYYTVQTSWLESPPYVRDKARPTRTLVVVFSRTGNTFTAAKEVARYFNADLLPIKASQYDRSIKGQIRASADADKEVLQTPIEHSTVDLSYYDLIILCSPTWWFRPAPPIWSFVKNHDFSGNSVFLIMTGNSRYKERFIDQFENLVTSKKGNFLDLLFIRRGRFLWQKKTDEINKEIRTAVENKLLPLCYSYQNSDPCP